MSSNFANINLEKYMNFDKVALMSSSRKKEQLAKEKIKIIIDRRNDTYFDINEFNKIHLSKFKNFREVIKRVNMDKLKFLHLWFGKIVTCNIDNKLEYKCRIIVGWNSDSIFGKEDIKFICTNPKLFTSVEGYTYKNENDREKFVFHFAVHRKDVIEPTYNMEDEIIDPVILQPFNPCEKGEDYSFTCYDSEEPKNIVECEKKLINIIPGISHRTSLQKMLYEDSMKSYLDSFPDKNLAQRYVKYLGVIIGPAFSHHNGNTGKNYKQYFQISGWPENMPNDKSNDLVFFATRVSLREKSVCVEPIKIMTKTKIDDKYIITKKYPAGYFISPTGKELVVKKYNYENSGG